MTSTETKLRHAVEAATGLDYIFEEVSKTHKILLVGGDEVRITTSPNTIIVSEQFVKQKTLAQIIAALWHEARHVYWKHHDIWNQYREKIASKELVLYPEFYETDGAPKWSWLIQIFNIVADAQVNGCLKLIPAIRDGDGYFYDKAPLSKVLWGPLPNAYERTLFMEEPRKEMIQHLLDTGHDYYEDNK